MKNSLVKRFYEVGLILKISDKPLVRRVNKEIFQMTIKREVKGTRRTEWFEIYQGNSKNYAQILDTDLKSKQVLLLVKEKEREFEVTERKRYNADIVRNNLINAKVKFKETARHFIITRKTSGRARHFLMGVDERQLFIAQLNTGVTNIIEAKKQLGNTVLFHEGARKMTPGRQGEWFFVEATKEQEDILNLLLDKKRIFVLEKESIGKHAGKPKGNPHIADELVVLPDKEKIIVEAQSSKWANKNKDLSVVKPIYSIRKKEVFVRGCVRHKDHKTIKYTKWHQVILNNEGNTTDFEVSGINWFD